jgi:hypothetical protein
LMGDAGLEGLPPLCAAAGHAAVVVLVGPADDPVGLAALEGRPRTSSRARSIPSSSTARCATPWSASAAGTR